MTIPMCWKCTHKIVEPDVTGCAYVLIGCEICDKVVNYTTAQIWCPIVKELQERKHETVPLKITPL